MRHTSGPWLAILAATSSLALLILAASTTASPHRVAAATLAPSSEAGSQASPLQNPCTDQPFITVMTGDGLGSISAAISSYSKRDWAINFTLKPGEVSKGFVDYTRRAAINHDVLAIVLDGKVLSAPAVQAALTTGGMITGNFTQEAATTLALEMESGALPVPLSVVSIDRQAGNLNIVVKVADGLSATVDMLEQTRQILEKRLQPFHVPIVNIPTASVEVRGNDSLVIQILNFRDDPQKVIDLIQTIGLLEFVDFSKPAACQMTMPTTGQYILTDTQLKRRTSDSQPAGQPTSSPLLPTQSPTLAATNAAARLGVFISANLDISDVFLGDFPGILGLQKLQISGFQHRTLKGIS